MQQYLHYDTAYAALEKLKLRGYTTDFNLECNCLCRQKEKFNIDDFEIRDIYRYEGDTDPADEVVVYAIESASGIKGHFISGYGSSSDAVTTTILNRLKKAI